MDGGLNLIDVRHAEEVVQLVAVSIDDPGMEAKVNLFADELKLSFEILYDAPGRIKQQYQTTGVPETFIIGRPNL